MASNTAPKSARAGATPSRQRIAVRRTRARMLRRRLVMMAPLLHHVRDSELTFQARQTLDIDWPDDVHHGQLARLGIEDQEPDDGLAFEAGVDLDVLLGATAHVDHALPVRSELRAYLLDQR